MQLVKILIFAFLYFIVRYVYYCAFTLTPRIVFINVGQGDATLLVLNSNNGILIDGGPDLSLENSLVGFYTYPWCFIKRIYVSHFHADHLKGFSNLIPRCLNSQTTFNDIIVSSYDSVRLHDLFPNLISLEVFRSTYLGSVEKFKISADKTATIYTIWPRNNTAKISDENDRSLIQLVDIGTYEVLFTGDASGDIIEQALTPNILELIDGRLEVYKVPHHGSSTGRSLKVLEMLRPVNCVISVGRNSFGHPNPQVLSDLDNYGCEIRRTDLEGNIELKL
jgi:competence protein ComEC